MRIKEVITRDVLLRQILQTSNIRNIGTIVRRKCKLLSELKGLKYFKFKFFSSVYAGATIEKRTVNNFHLNATLPVEVGE